jgi:invasion protein IalB
MKSDVAVSIPITLAMPVAQSAEFPQRPYSHHDWEIACDNTPTCRAAGYQADEEKNKASILLTRAAGPSQPVRAQLQLADTASAIPSSVQMRIDGRALGAVKIGANAIGELTAAQIAALLDALVKDARLGWNAEGMSWTVSARVRMRCC